jgi:hypothetical protein
MKKWVWGFVLLVILAVFAGWGVVSLPSLANYSWSIELRRQLYNVIYPKLGLRRDAVWDHADARCAGQAGVCVHNTLKTSEFFAKHSRNAVERGKNSEVCSSKSFRKIPSMPFPPLLHPSPPAAA